MKIVEIREKTVPISSPIRNAYTDFSKMTLSLVAVGLVLFDRLPAAVLLPAFALHGYALSASVLGWTSAPVASRGFGATTGRRDFPRRRAMEALSSRIASTSAPDRGTCL